MGEDDTLAARVARDFDDMRPLIAAEWSGVDEAKVAETEGDLDRLLGVLGDETGHSKTLLRRHLDELHGECRRRGEAGRHLEEVGVLLKRLESRLKDAIDVDLDPRATLRKNPLMSLMVAWLIGLVMGVLLRGGGGGRR
ncbi:MAG: hypothetical protein ACFCGT_01580 [Sandaracinaceae bacterium]